MSRSSSFSTLLAEIPATNYHSDTGDNNLLELELTLEKANDHVVVAASCTNKLSR
jgi:hypothetical protein